MSWYGRYILPRLTDLVCSAGTHRRQREKIVPLARGRVLEIGLGSGLNLAHYDADQVEMVWGVDPSGAQRSSTLAKVRTVRFGSRHRQVPPGTTPANGELLSNRPLELRARWATDRELRRFR